MLIIPTYNERENIAVLVARIRDMTAGFVGYQANTLRQINLDEIGSEWYAFLMEMKF